MAPSRRCYTTYTPRLAAPAGLCSFTALYTLHTIQLHNAVQHTTYATPLTSRLTSHLTARLISHQGSSTSELPPDVVEELDLPGLLDIVRSPRPVAPPPAGSYHVALRLQSNHIGSVEPGAFAALPWLCGLDLSLNHLEALVLTPDTVPRLRTLCLRNNRLLSVAPLGELRSLRQLDVSLNQIESLEGA